MQKTPENLGTFEGVFVPTLLTITGVILYTRTTWLVGRLGLLKALAVILISYSVAISTAFAICSIITNIRVGCGGAFSLLTKTLGIEAGGSIGCALYLSQTLATVLYIFGFREGWLRLFPSHPAWAVDATVFGVVTILAFTSARLAFRVQYGILLIVMLSMFSIVLGVTQQSEFREIPWTVDRNNVDLFTAFSIFFPAVTGVLAGVNMSGELKTPRESIRKGALGAILVSLIFYLLVAVAGALSLEPDDLVSDTSLVNIGRWDWLVVAGLLCATFSSALNCIVGAPRILQALAQHRVVPKGRTLDKLAPNGEPRRCLAVTSFIVACGLAIRELNTVAPLITLFFLLTYGVINITLCLQQGLRLPHFRPTFRVPLGVSLVGSLGCLAGMWIVSPSFFFLALFCVVTLYLWLEKRAPRGPYGQMRAGLLVGLTHRALVALSRIPDRNAWHTHAVVVVPSSVILQNLQALGRALVQKGGSLAFFTERGDPAERIVQTVESFNSQGFLAQHGSFLSSASMESILPALTALNTSPLPPNLLLCPLTMLNELQEETLERFRSLNLGLWFYNFPDTEDSRDQHADATDNIWNSLCVWVEEGVEEVESLSLVILSVWRLHKLHAIPVRCFKIGSSGPEDQELETLRERVRIPDAEYRYASPSTFQGILADELLPSRSLNFFVSRSFVSSKPDDLKPKEDLIVAILSGAAEAD